jgi:hypothetical protein
MHCRIICIFALDPSQFTMPLIFFIFGRPCVQTSSLPIKYVCMVYNYDVFGVKSWEICDEIKCKILVINPNQM